jgi:hypothetical protein
MHWKFYLYIILLNIAQAVVFLPGAKAMDNRNQLSIRSPQRFSTAIRQAESRVVIPAKPSDFRAQRTQQGAQEFSRIRREVTEHLIYNLYGFNVTAQVLDMPNYHAFLDRLRKCGKFNFSHWKDIINECETIYEEAKQKFRYTR